MATGGIAMAIRALGLGHRQAVQTPPAASWHTGGQAGPPPWVRDPGGLPGPQGAQ